MKSNIPAAVVPAAWLLFIVSFSLPVTNVLEQGGTPPGTPLTGWQTFMAALQMMCYPAGNCEVSTVKSGGTDFCQMNLLKEGCASWRQYTPVCAS